FLKAFEPVPGREREADVDVRRKLGAEAAGRLARAPQSGPIETLQDEHVPAPAPGQVVGDACSHYAGADDDDLSGAPAHVERSGLPFGPLFASVGPHGTGGVRRCQSVAAW